MLERNATNVQDADDDHLHLSPCEPALPLAVEHVEDTEQLGFKGAAAANIGNEQELSEIQFSIFI